MLQSVFFVSLLSMLFLVSIHFVMFTKLYNKLFKEKPELYDVHLLKFKGYLKDFNKSYYGTEEYERRFENFKVNLKDIARLNALEGNTVFGLTKFSDMSKQEFAERVLLKPGITRCISRHKRCVNDYKDELPTMRHKESLKPSFDWRKKNVVKPVLDQKDCLGCWAFSIVGVMESMAAIRGLDHERRSIQELLDCSKYNDGCRGGSVSLAVDYLCNKIDIVTEEQYPLTLETELCRLPAKNSGRKLKEFVYQCNLNEHEIVNQTFYHGPLIAAVDASNWLNYIGGVIRWACPPNEATHVIQIIGYDGYGRNSDSDPPYYIIRNSFGEDFGDHGYVKIAMGHNVCGIADQVTRIDVV